MASNYDHLIDIAGAIQLVAPGCAWSMEDNDYDKLNWMDDPAKKPSKEVVLAKAEEVARALPLKRLRLVRDRMMKECDWVTLRAMRTGEPIPQEWADYMQALADITKTSPEPMLQAGELLNVTWPVKPE